MSIALTRVWLLSLAISTAVHLCASEKKFTEAENDGLIGRVRSVHTSKNKIQPEAIQPDGLSIYLPVICGDCEYDQAGNHIKQGEFREGRFEGTTARYLLDGCGNMQDQVWENEKGEVVRRIEFSNGRKVRDTSYLEGRPQFTTEFTYDSSGRPIDSHVYQADGTEFSSAVMSYDPQGNVIEEIDEGPDDHFLHYKQTLDPKTNDLESFTGIDRDGLVRLQVRLQGESVASFWQAAGDAPTYGTGYIFDTGPNQREAREYKWDGTYTRTVFTYTDDKKRHPKQIILLDTNGDPWIRADYEYEFDSVGNWTKRTVWEWTRDWGGEEESRRLIETDSRTLTYYPTEGDPNN